MSVKRKLIENFFETNKIDIKEKTNFSNYINQKMTFVNFYITSKLIYLIGNNFENLLTISRMKKFYGWFLKRFYNFENQKEKKENLYSEKTFKLDGAISDKKEAISQSLNILKNCQIIDIVADDDNKDIIVIKNIDILKLISNDEISVDSYSLLFVSYYFLNIIKQSGKLNSVLNAINSNKGENEILPKSWKNENRKDFLINLFEYIKNYHKLIYKQKKSTKGDSDDNIVRMMNKTINHINYLNINEKVNLDIIFKSLAEYSVDVSETINKFDKKIPEIYLDFLLDLESNINTTKNKKNAESFKIKIQKVVDDILPELKNNLLNLKETERAASVKVRIGQQKLRNYMLALYEYQCVITKSKIVDALIISHIIPWSESIEKRLIWSNALLLSSSIDKLFDRYLISFDNDGFLYVSKKFLNRFGNDYVIELTKIGVPIKIINKEVSLFELLKKHTKLSLDDLTKIKENMRIHYKHTKDIE